eukprot:scaffold170876_cov21-Tisochrysis_lutea.AAC.1
MSVSSLQSVLFALAPWNFRAPVFPSAKVSTCMPAACLPLLTHRPALQAADVLLHKVVFAGDGVFPHPLHSNAQVLACLKSRQLVMTPCL